VIARHGFRVTRNADPEFVEDEAQDLRTAVVTVLRRRRRSRHAVRLEVERSMGEDMRRLLVRELDLDPADVYDLAGPLDLGGLWALYELERPDLKDEPWEPVTQPRLAGAGADGADLFEVLRSRDVLVHHPYDSFGTSVEAFIDQAARDPDVLAIKQTLYRTSGPESAIVRALIKAAETGKQVVALVELKARFDEEANIAWAGVLEEAGVHVVYGVVGLKTHAKISLVVRKEHEGIRRYCHVGTGNYNPDTARVYEDIGLMSSNAELGEDLTDLFNYLTGYSRKRKYRRLLVAPLTLRSRLLELIREESERPDARIVIKVNSLVDPEIIQALYEASDAGAAVDLIVRGMCSLRPGVPGLSERIRVRSIVGPFLEHSRIFKFGGGDGVARYFIGSADLMTRNLDRRVEAVTPVMDLELRRRLDEVLEANLSQDVSAWALHADGTWRQVGSASSSQERLRDLAVARAEPPTREHA
jgi:polyphosphate kinase